MIYCANPSEQFQSYKTEIETAVLEVMRSKVYILGEQVSLLEKEFASYIGTTNAIGVANGTDAIEIALRSLEIGPGDEVISVSHTAVATIAAIEASGAEAVLVDIDADYYSMDFNQLDKVFTSKTKAIVLVHLYGHPANLDAIEKYCKAKNFF